MSASASTPPARRPVRVAIAEDRDDLRTALLRRLGFFPDVSVVAAAADGAELVARLAEFDATGRPEVVLMDIEMPGTDGVTATATLRDRWPEMVVVMLTVFEDDRRIGEALAAGAVGYLLKDEPAEAIVSAALEAAAGGAPLSGRVAGHLVRRVRAEAQAQQATEAALARYGLTAREREVLALLATGGTDEDIGERLFISPHTVQSHTKSLYRKLSVNNRAGATRVAAALGLA